MNEEQHIVFRYPGHPIHFQPIGDVAITPEGWAVASEDVLHANWVREHRDIDHDPHFTKWCADWIEPGKAVVDIGANIGTHSIPYLRRGPSHLISVEPSPTLFECLRRNLLKEITRIGATTSVSAFRCGAGQYCAVVPYHYNREVPGMSYVGYGSSDTIEIVPLHHLIIDLPEEENIGLLKIDVEGYEPFVIMGAKDNVLSPKLGKRRPVVIMEVNNEWLSRHQWNTGMLLELMASLDYKELGTWPPEYDALPREELISKPVFEKCFIPGTAD